MALPGIFLAFPVIQLLESLEAEICSHCGGDGKVSSNSAFRKLGSVETKPTQRNRKPIEFPVIQLLESLEVKALKHHYTIRLLGFQ